MKKQNISLVKSYKYMSWVTNNLIYDFDYLNLDELIKTNIYNNFFQYTYYGQVDLKLRDEIEKSRYIPFSISFELPINLSNLLLNLYIKSIKSILFSLLKSKIYQSFSDIVHYKYENFVTFYPVNDQYQYLYVHNYFKVDMDQELKTQIQGKKAIGNRLEIEYVLDQYHPEIYSLSEKLTDTNLLVFPFDLSINYREINLIFDKVQSDKSMIFYKINSAEDVEIVTELSLAWNFEIHKIYQSHLIIKLEHDSEIINREFISNSIRQIKEKKIPYLRIRPEKISELGISDVLKIKTYYSAIRSYIDLIKENINLSKFLIRYINYLDVDSNNNINLYLFDHQQYLKFIELFHYYFNLNLSIKPVDTLINQVALIKYIDNYDKTKVPIYYENQVIIEGIDNQKYDNSETQLVELNLYLQNETGFGYNDYFRQYQSQDIIDIRNKFNGIFQEFPLDGIFNKELLSEKCKTSYEDFNIIRITNDEETVVMYEFRLVKNNQLVYLSENDNLTYQQLSEMFNKLWLSGKIISDWSCYLKNNHGKYSYLM